MPFDLVDEVGNPLEEYLAGIRDASLTAGGSKAFANLPSEAARKAALAPPIKAGLLLPFTHGASSPEEFRAMAIAEEQRQNQINSNYMGFRQSFAEGLSRGQISGQVLVAIADASTSGDAVARDELIVLNSKFQQAFAKNPLEGSNFLADWAIRAAESSSGFLKAIATSMLVEAGIAAGTTLAIGALIPAPEEVVTFPAMAFFGALRGARKFKAVRKLAAAGTAVRAGKTVRKVARSSRLQKAEELASGINEALGKTVIRARHIQMAAHSASASRGIGALTVAAQFSKEGQGEFITRLAEQGIDPDIARGIAPYVGWAYGLVESFETFNFLARGGIENLGIRGLRKVLGDSVIGTLASIVARYEISVVKESLEEFGQELVIGVGERATQARAIADQFGQELDKRIIDGINAKPEIRVTPVGEMIVKGMEAFKDALGPVHILGLIGGPGTISGEVQTSRGNRIVQQRRDLATEIKKLESEGNLAGLYALFQSRGMVDESVPIGERVKMINDAREAADDTSRMASLIDIIGDTDVESLSDAELNKLAKEINATWLEDNKEWLLDGGKDLLRELGFDPETRIPYGTPIEDREGKVKTNLEYIVELEKDAFDGPITKRSGKIQTYIDGLSPVEKTLYHNALANAVFNKRGVRDQDKITALKEVAKNSDENLKEVQAAVRLQRKDQEENEINADDVDRMLDLLDRQEERLLEELEVVGSFDPIDPGPDQTAVAITEELDDIDRQRQELNDSLSSGLSEVETVVRLGPEAEADRASRKAKRARLDKKNQVKTDLEREVAKLNQIAKRSGGKATIEFGETFEKVRALRIENARLNPSKKKTTNKAKAQKARESSPSSTDAHRVILNTPPVKTSKASGGAQDTTHAIVHEEQTVEEVTTRGEAFDILREDHGALTQSQLVVLKILSPTEVEDGKTAGPVGAARAEVIATMFDRASNLVDPSLENIAAVLKEAFVAMKKAGLTDEKSLRAIVPYMMIMIRSNGFEIKQLISDGRTSLLRAREAGPAFDESLDNDMIDQLEREIGLYNGLMDVLVVSTEPGSPGFKPLMAERVSTPKILAILGQHFTREPVQDVIDAEDGAVVAAPEASEEPGDRDRRLEVRAQKAYLEPFGGGAAMRNLSSRAYAGHDAAALEEFKRADKAGVAAAERVVGAAETRELAEAYAALARHDPSEQGTSVSLGNHQQNFVGEELKRRGFKTKQDVTDFLRAGNEEVDLTEDIKAATEDPGDLEQITADLERETATLNQIASRPGGKRTAVYAEQFKKVGVLQERKGRLDLKKKFKDPSHTIKIDQSLPFSKIRALASALVNAFLSRSRAMFAADLQLFSDAKAFHVETGFSGFESFLSMVSNAERLKKRPKKGADPRLTVVGLRSKAGQLHNSHNRKVELVNAVRRNTRDLSQTDEKAIAAAVMDAVNEVYGKAVAEKVAAQDAKIRKSTAAIEAIKQERKATAPKDYTKAKRDELARLIESEEKRIKNALETIDRLRSVGISTIQREDFADSTFPDGSDAQVKIAIQRLMAAPRIHDQFTSLERQIRATTVGKDRSPEQAAARKAQVMALYGRVDDLYFTHRVAPELLYGEKYVEVRAFIAKSLRSGGKGKIRVIGNKDSDALVRNKISIAFDMMVFYASEAVRLTRVTKFDALQLLSRDRATEQSQLMEGARRIHRGVFGKDVAYPDALSNRSAKSSKARANARAWLESWAIDGPLDTEEGRRIFGRVLANKINTLMREEGFAETVRSGKQFLDLMADIDNGSPEGPGGIPTGKWWVAENLGEGRDPKTGKPRRSYFQRATSISRIIPTREVLRLMRLMIIQAATGQTADQKFNARHKMGLLTNMNRDPAKVVLRAFSVALHRMTLHQRTGKMVDDEELVTSATKGLTWLKTVTIEGMTAAEQLASIDALIKTTKDNDHAATLMVYRKFVADKRVYDLIKIEVTRAMIAAKEDVNNLGANVPKSVQQSFYTSFKNAFSFSARLTLDGENLVGDVDLEDVILGGSSDLSRAIEGRLDVKDFALVVSFDRWRTSEEPQEHPIAMAALTAKERAFIPEIITILHDLIMNQQVLAFSDYNFNPEEGVHHAKAISGRKQSHAIQSKVPELKQYPVKLVWTALRVLNSHMREISSPSLGGIQPQDTQRAYKAWRMQRRDLSSMDLDARAKNLGIDVASSLTLAESFILEANEASRQIREIATTPKEVRDPTGTRVRELHRQKAEALSRLMHVEALVETTPGEGAKEQYLKPVRTQMAALLGAVFEELGSMTGEARVGVQEMRDGVSRDIETLKGLGIVSTDPQSPTSVETEAERLYQLYRMTLIAAAKQDALTAERALVDSVNRAREATRKGYHLQSLDASRMTRALQDNLLVPDAVAPIGGLLPGEEVLMNSDGRVIGIDGERSIRNPIQELANAHYKANVEKEQAPAASVPSGEFFSDPTKPMLPDDVFPDIVERTQADTPQIQRQIDFIAQKVAADAAAARPAKPTNVKVGELGSAPTKPVPVMTRGERIDFAGGLTVRTQLIDALPDSPLVSMASVKAIIETSFPQVSVEEVGDGTFILRAYGKEARVTFDPDNALYEDGRLAGGLYTPAGTQITDSEGRVLGERDLIALSGVSSDITSVRHEVMEWFAENVLSPDQRRILLRAFPSDQEGRPYDGVAKAMENFNGIPPASGIGRIFAAIRRFAIAIGMIPMSSQEVLDQIRLGTAQTVTPGHPFLSQTSKVPDLVDIPPVEVLDKMSLPRLRGLARSMGLDPRVMETRKQAIEAMRGNTWTSGIGEVLGSIAALDAREASGRPGPYRNRAEIRGGMMTRIGKNVGELSDKVFLHWNMNLFSKLAILGNHNPNDPFIREGQALMDGIREERRIAAGLNETLEKGRGGRDQTAMRERVFARGDKNLIEISVGAKRVRIPVDVAMKIVAYHKDEEGGQKALASATDIIFETGVTFGQIDEIRMKGGISVEDQKRIVSQVESDPTLKKFIEDQARMRDEAGDVLKEVIDKFIKVLGELGAKVSTEGGNVLVAEITPELALELGLDKVTLSQISSFVKVKNQTTIHVEQDQHLSAGRESGTSFLYRQGTIQGRVGAQGQTIRIPSLVKDTYDHINKVSKIAGQMIPLYRLRRLVNNKMLQTRITQVLGPTFLKDLKHAINLSEGRFDEKTDFDRAADWLIAKTTIAGLVSHWTFVKMMMSFPLAANRLRNPLNILRAIKPGTAESREQFEATGLYKMRYVYGFRSDVNLHEAWVGQHASRRLAGKAGFSGRALGLIRYPDRGALWTIYKAAEIETRETRPELSGDALWKETEKLFDHLVTATQPISEKAYLAHLIAGRRGLSRGLLFYGQRTSMLNTVIVDFDRWRHAPTPAMRAEGGRRFIFTATNVFFVNSSIMVMIGLARRPIHEAIGAFWGDDPDKEEPDENSFIGRYLAELTKQSVGLFPGFAEFMEFLTAPYQAGRAGLTGDVVREMKAISLATTKMIGAMIESDNARGMKSRRAAEDEAHNQLLRLIDHSVNLAGFGFGIPVRGARSILLGTADFEDVFGDD